MLDKYQEVLPLFTKIMKEIISATNKSSYIYSKFNFISISTATYKQVKYETLLSQLIHQNT